MLRIMVIRKDEGDERRVLRVGPVLRHVREEPDAAQGDEALQETAPFNGEPTGEDRPDEAYNRTEDGAELFFQGKLTGGRKLRDIDVIRLRRNEEQLSYNQWAVIYKVAMAVIWKAMKGLTYKHLNWRYPPIR